MVHLYVFFLCFPYYRSNNFILFSRFTYNPRLNCGSVLQGTAAPLRYKFNPLMSAYKIENRKKSKPRQPQSLFDKIFSQKSHGPQSNNASKKTSEEFFSPLSKIDDSKTSYGGYRSEYQSKQKQKPNQMIIRKPWLDTNSSQQNDKTSYPPLATKTISKTPTVDRKQGSYVENTVERMLRSYQNLKELHSRSYKIPKRQKFKPDDKLNNDSLTDANSSDTRVLDSRNVDTRVSGSPAIEARVTRGESVRMRRVPACVEESDALSSAASDYDTMSSSSEVPGKQVSR